MLSGLPMCDHERPPSITQYRLWALADPDIGVGGKLPPPPRPPRQKFGIPLDGNFKLYMNHCHRDPVNIFYINMRNSLFIFLILFEVLDE